MNRVRGRSTETSGDDSGSLLDRLRGRSTGPQSGESGSWFARAKAKYGLGAVLAAVGVALFLFPEPITSTAGLVLVGAGVVLWLLG